MEHPVEITFRNMGRSDAMEQRVRERVDKLERHVPDVQACRVVIEADHKHHRKGNLFHVRVDVIVPGADLVADREPPKDHAHEDAYVAIRDAFDAVERQVKKWAAKRRHDVKYHEVPCHGVVTTLYENHGVIMTPDDRLVPFHANTLVGHAYDRLEPGVQVRFAEAEGEDGPRASTVHVVGKHHLVG